MRPRNHVAPARILIRSLIGVISLVACVTLAVVTLGTRRVGPNAPPAGAARDSWQWVASAPGTNIYIAYPETHRNEGVVSTWVDREFSSNLAGIKASRIELRQFDCLRKRSRRSSTVSEYRTLAGGDRMIVSSAPSSWTQVQPGTPDERVLLVVCGRADFRSPSSAGMYSPRLAAS